MELEQKISQKLNQYPAVKRAVKRAYQHVMVALSAKKDHEGEIVRLSPDDPEHEYFFGYYDKSPWDASGRYVICLKAENTWAEPAPKAPAELLLIDTAENNAARKIAETHAWNVQQGCMAQWLGPGFDREIIYNDFRDGRFVSVVLDVFTGRESVRKMPVYSVSSDGRFALTLDFARLHRLRPGYGYSNLEDETKDQKLPDAPCVWRLDLAENTAEPVLSYTGLASFEPRAEMAGAEHKVNHIMLSPDGKRFMVLHRWRNGTRKYSRLVTANADGTELYNLSDDDMVSHCCWQDDGTILAFENKKGTGAGYYRMRDRTQEYCRLWPHIGADGHPSFSPDGRLVVTDTYPNRKRMAVLKVLNEDFNIVIAKVFAPFRYDNETRCDLHPRWSRDGKAICFDSVFEGHRGLYMVPLDSIRFAYRESVGTKLPPRKEGGRRIRIVYLMTACKKCGPTQQTLNLIRNLDPEEFEAVLITLYDEEADSRMADYLPYVSAHALVKTGKRSILLGRDAALRKKLEELAPDVIHTVGVFPDYAVSRIGKYKQVHTLRNYVYEDYPAKFGRLRGWILARMQLSAAKKSARTVTCSESLAEIYREKLHRSYAFIRNGVDLDRYSLPAEGEKRAIRRELGLPEDAFVWVYTGQFIERKDLPFLLENYTEGFGSDGHAVLLLLGDGPERAALEEKYGSLPGIDLRGSVSNVEHWLKACDAYVSASRSEGLPNGVLEAMATGLPVVLSDIEQHREILRASEAPAGFLYRRGDGKDLIAQMKRVYGGDAAQLGRAAYASAHENFSAGKMSRSYQDLYHALAEEKEP